MKTLIVSPSFYPAFYFGGPIYTSYNLARALADNDVSVSVVTTNTGGRGHLDVIANKWISESNNFRIKYYGAALSNGFSPFMYVLLWSDIKKADVVYLISVFSPPTPLTLFLSFLLKKKIVVSPRGQFGKWSLSQGSRFKKIWIKLFISPFLKIIKWHATSEQELLDIKKQFHGADVFVAGNIPGDINISESPAAKNRLYYKRYFPVINENTRIIVSMGRLAPVKGFDILITSFCKVKEQIPDVKLLIAGEDFGLKDKLLKLIKLNDLEDHVCLTGHLSDSEKHEFLINADLFALPSHHENFGMAYLESLAAGTPIVASRNTPWADVEKYECGRWVNNSAEHFADAITELLSGNLPKMSQHAKRYVQDRFAKNKLVQSFISEISE